MAAGLGANEQLEANRLPAKPFIKGVSIEKVHHLFKEYGRRVV